MAKKKTAKKTTALAIVRKSRPTASLVVHDPHRMLPQVLPADVTAIGALGDDAAVGALGLVEVKLTAEEEAILSEPVNVSDVLFKPPHGIAYLSHPVYTKWFNRAFGRLGWAIVPKSKPIKSGALIMCPYMLYIHGQPAAFAWGEQDYHENNAAQTYGDAVEATVASALRRCAKRLGVGLELWDKAWLASLPKSGAKPEPKREPPKAQVDFTPAQPLKINDAQRDRLVKIVEKTGRAQADVLLWLKKVYGVSGTKDILRSDYAAIEAALSARGALPMPGDGQ